MLIGAFGILSGFAFVVLTAAGPRGKQGFALTAVVAVLTWSALPAGTLPDPVWGALSILTLTAFLLWQPERRWVAAMGAGAALAVWLSVLVGQGLPLSLSLAVVLAVAAAVVALTQRSERFAPAELVEEALLVCLALSLLVACWETVTSGYGTAAVFTAERVTAPASVSAPWALQLSLSLIALGGLYGFWKRR